METLNIRISKGKIMVSKIAIGTLLAVFCVLFCLGLVNKWSLAHYVALFDHLLVMIILGLCVAISGYSFVWMLLRTRADKPALVLEADGYIDNIGLLKGHKYLFSEIDRFEAKTVMMNKAIAVYFKDVDAFMDSQTGYKKKMLKATYSQLGTPLSIPAAGFDMGYEDLLAELNKRLANAR